MKVSAVDKIAKFINNSKTTQKILKGVDKNPALYSAGIAFVAASILRPAAVFVLPIKDKEDKKYTIGASVSAGIAELALASLLFIPLNKQIGKASKKLYQTKNTIYSENNLLLRDYKSLNNRFSKILALPLTSYLRFAMISPLVNLVCKKDKKLDVKA